MQTQEELLEKWRKKLKDFLEKPEVARNMSDAVAMGVQHGRITALRECIAELGLLQVNIAGSTGDSSSTVS
jgi:hypothetical protein